MKLNITNFGMFDNKEFQFNPGLNLVTSDTNAKGKTTVRVAIEFALSGKAQDKDISDFIPYKMPKASPNVSITDLEVLKLVNRSTNPNMISTSKGTFKVDIRKTKDPIEDLGIKRAVVNFLCNGYNFFNLTPEEQYEIMADYLTSSGIKISDYYELKGDDLKEFTNEITSKDIDILYNRFFEERTQNTRNIKFQEEIIKQNETLLGNDSVVDVEDIEKEILSLSEKLEKQKPYKNNNETNEMKSLLTNLKNSPVRDKFPEEKRKELEEITSKGVSNKNKIEAASKFKGACPIISGITCNSIEEIKKYTDSLVEENNKLRERGGKLFEEQVKFKKEADEERQKEIADLNKKIADIEHQT